MEENKKYNIYGIIITVFNLFLLFTIGYILQLKDLRLSFFLIGGLFTIAIKLIEILQKESNRKKLMCFINYSLLVFLVGGLFIFYAGKFEQMPDLGSGLILHLIITLPIFLIFSFIFFIFILLNNNNDKLQKDIEKKEIEKKNAIETAIEEIKTNTERLLTNSGVKNIKKLIYDELTKYNCLIAIGGLMSLNKNEGSQLLKEYLQMKAPGSEDSLKILYLVVPNYALKYLKKIVNNLKNNDLLKQIRIITLKPFILMQGFLIVGDLVSTEEGEESGIEIKGYLKYKTSLTEDESMVESGIYTDLSNGEKPIPKELKESLKFIYDLLLDQRYKHPHNYVITQQFKNKKNSNYKYELKMFKSSMCLYCDLENCTDCPIYKLEATSDNVKSYFKSKGKDFIEGTYEAVTSDI